jgi:hypothetical protein
MSSQTTLDIPTGLADILKDLSKEVLAKKPSDIVQFCSEYFQKKAQENALGT